MRFNVGSNHIDEDGNVYFSQQIKKQEDSEVTKVLYYSVRLLFKFPRARTQAFKRRVNKIAEIIIN